ncbi:hypothetical protein BG015_006465, partial [Linnemannia schmuckeri]
YAGILRGTKNRGATASNPISIGTHTSSTTPVVAAPTNITAPPAAAIAPAASAAPSGTSANMANTTKEQMAKLEQQQKKSIASIRVEMQNGINTLRKDMETLFAKVLAAVNGTGTQPTNETMASTPAEAMEEETNEEPVQEDVELPQAPPPTCIVPDSLPSSPASTVSVNAVEMSKLAKSQGRTMTPPTNGPAYSVNTLRPNIQGGLSIAKADLHRDESTFTRKEKNKAVVRETPQDNISTPQLAQQTHQQAEEHTNAALVNLNATIADLRNDLAQQGEQYQKETAEL